jgi:hypothetical protein
MMTRIKQSAEKLLLVTVVGLNVVSWIWYGQQQGVIRRIRSQPVAIRFAGANSPIVPPGRIAQESPVWPEPSAQSAGRGWVYELFTPPVIYYNGRDRTYTVTAPADWPEGKPSLGIQLLAVKPELYPLQLVGYVGPAHDYRATFIRPQHPEACLVRPGHNFAELGLTFTHFEVKKVLVPTSETGPVYEAAAFAVLTEDGTGREVWLDSRGPHYTDKPLAVLQTLAGGSRHELHAGDSFSIAGESYRIEAVQLTPPEVRVGRQIMGLPEAETHLLRPINSPLPPIRTQVDKMPRGAAPAVPDIAAR